MYLAVTNEISGKKVFDAPALREVIAELRKYDK
jgi:hypothetical protein